MSLLSDQIFACDDLPRKEVKIPEWGVTLYVRMLTAGEMDTVIAVKGEAFDWTHLLILATVDESGAPVFNESQKEALSKKNNKAVRRLLDAISSVNRFGTEEVAALEKEFPAE